MKKSVKAVLMVLLSAVLVLTSVTYQKASAYTPPYTTVKIGLFFGSSALPSANLQNATGLGSGYQFGILDANRQFTPLGAATSETKISMLRDTNMFYNSGGNKYEPGSEGGVVVGCYHIRLGGTFASYPEAFAALGGNPAGFVRYSNGAFLAMVGNYISAEAASAAIGANGITNGSVDCGSSSTVTVVRTGTNTILFEFDYGTAYWLVVMPVSADGSRCKTWFKNELYYGGFQYARIGGEDLTVINVVNVEDYVKGVIPYEMISSWPLEAMKAQAVCARTYAMANLGKHSGFDLCTTEDCQVYFGTEGANATTDAAVEQTAGQYLTYNGTLCQTYYSSSDGGATECSENVWSQAIPYLRGVVDPYEVDIASAAPGYKWTVTYNQSEITSRMRSKGYSCGTIVSLAVTQYTDVGNAYKVTLTDDGGKKFTFTKGESIRSALGVKSIRFSINGAGAGANDIYVNGGGETISGGLSSSYAVGQSGISELLGQNKVYAITGTGETVAVGATETQQNTSGVFTIQGTGHGHNVGMSQWGAYSMAKHHNMTYEQILRFYFTGAVIG